jgi:hypothetical protein
MLKKHFLDNPGIFFRDCFLLSKTNERKKYFKMYKNLFYNHIGGLELMLSGIND